MKLKSEGPDPRTGLGSSHLKDAQQVRVPSVVSARSDNGLIIGVLGALGLGIITFVSLQSGREAPPTLEPTGVTAAVAPEPVRVVPAPPPPAPVKPAPPPPPPIVEPQPPIRSDRLRSPTLVIDLGKGSVASADAGNSIGTNTDGLGVNEAFVARLGRVGAGVATATKIETPSIVVPEGTIISGVLETAINSDLPGYVRAVVGHDVRGFDSSRVLIPRGSRLIGQYRSGLAIGESRAFVIWTRVLRPDGVSIQLSSPATDTLGRAGLTGEVDRHFLQRFGSAILLSVIGGGIDALADSNDNGIVVESAAQAQSIAQTALSKSIDIPPTVKVGQGTAIRIFTAKDLYFPQDAAKAPGPAGQRQ